MHHTRPRLEELMRLQGFKAGRIRVPPGVTPYQMGGMVGNSQDVILTAKILGELLRVIFDCRAVSRRRQ